MGGAAFIQAGAFIRQYTVLSTYELLELLFYTIYNVLAVLHKKRGFFFCLPDSTSGGFCYKCSKFQPLNPIQWANFNLSYLKQTKPNEMKILCVFEKRDLKKLPSTNESSSREVTEWQHEV